MSIQQGSNTKDHRGFANIAGVDWGEFEEVDSPSPEINNEVRFYPPGSAFETSGGGVFKVDAFEAKRHWKVGRDAALVKQFDDAANKGAVLEGTFSFYEVVNGVLSATPYRTFPVFVSKAQAPGPNSASDDAMFTPAFSTTGGPQ